MASNSNPPSSDGLLPMNGDNESPMENTDRLIALVALVVSCTALLAATLQVVLEYSSSSPARHKCSESAIHVSHKEVEREWLFLSWKFKYSYPDIDMSVDRLLGALKEDTRSSIEGSFVGDMVMRTKTLAFHSVNQDNYTASNQLS